MTGRVERWLRASRLTSDESVDARVQELLESVRLGSERLPDESWDEASERKAEEFIAWLQREFAGRVFPHGAVVTDGDEPVVLSPTAPPAAGAPHHRLSTTSSPCPATARERLVLVAHYDTWRGPGADDNTTGEEIVKQYLVADAPRRERPPLTHVYLLAGSEECGLIGFTSQLVLGVGLSLANVAWPRACTRWRRWRCCSSRWRCSASASRARAST